VRNSTGCTHHNPSGEPLEAFLIIALGLVGVAGTVTVKKIFEKFGEDVYDSVKGYLNKSKRRVKTIDLSFTLGGTEFKGKVSAENDNEFLVAFQHLSELFSSAEQLVTTKTLPTGVTLQEYDWGDQKDLKSVSDDEFLADLLTYSSFKFDATDNTWNMTEAAYDQKRFLAKKKQG
jgi:hypothetical protein